MKFNDRRNLILVTPNQYHTQHKNLQMVNTFMPYSDFTQVAQSLDSRRLGKQRVEAYQVWIILGDIQIISKLLAIEQKQMKFREWVKALDRENKKQPLRVVRNLVTGELSTIPKDAAVYQLKKDESIVRVTDEHIVIRKNTSRAKDRFYDITTQILSPDEHIIKFGFAHHSLIVMWSQHLVALCAYINAMIAEWVRRGNVNTMVTFDVPDTYDVPSWVKDPKLHLNHRQALFAKEIDRKEQPWYVHQPDFANSGPFVEYIWYDLDDNTNFVPR